MKAVPLHIRRPESPADALSPDASNEADVVVLSKGRILYGVKETSALYNEDPAFLRAIIDALRVEVVRLESELGRQHPKEAAKLREHHKRK